MFKWLRSLHAAGDPDARVDEACWRRLRARNPWAAALPEARAQRLRTLTQEFLRSKDITPAADFDPNHEDRVLIASLCVLPVLDGGLEWLSGWRQLIVYPGQFGVRRHHHDDATGVVSEWNDELAGEAWDRGPVILSWADIAADLQEPGAGFCVVAHEIAHKLDALDGAMDGMPPLPGPARRQRWIGTFQRAYDALCADLEAGREAVIDEYAAEAPDEFFAVTSEYHFSAPSHLAEVMPQVAHELREFYGEPPFGQFPVEKRSS
ncbi:MAG TPA: M90 family metallopeptidase [Xanthomonadaceae bacterium]|nr:M90 family metallopeptidase [Xanthomonadaceae bacterium]